MCVPASTSAPCQPWRVRSCSSRRSANSLFLWRKSVPRHSRKPPSTASSGSALGRMRAAESRWSSPGGTTAIRSLLDERVGQQLLARVLGEDDDALGRREAVAARRAVVLPGCRAVEVARVAVGDQVELAEHEALSQRQRQRDVAR